MVSGEADRRTSRGPRATDTFGSQAGAVLDVLASLDLAWHDCYGESSPPEQVIEDIWLIADGDLSRFISAAYLAVTDFRDVRVWSDELPN